MARADHLSRVGLETGGANVQFAINPADGHVFVIEMNPRVSRSSALASKATGFPIAKIAALLAVGYTLDEIPNDITKKTPASFEPSLDYVAVKIPRWNFEKFPGADANARPANEVRRRSVGHRAYLRGSAAKSDCRAGYWHDRVRQQSSIQSRRKRSHYPQPSDYFRLAQFYGTKIVKKRFNKRLRLLFIRHAMMRGLSINCAKLLMRRLPYGKYGMLS